MPTTRRQPEVDEEQLKHDSRGLTSGFRPPAGEPAHAPVIYWKHLLMSNEGQ